MELIGQAGVGLIMLGLCLLVDRLGLPSLPEMRMRIRWLERHAASDKNGGRRAELSALKGGVLKARWWPCCLAIGLGLFLYALIRIVMQS